MFSACLESPICISGLLVPVSPSLPVHLSSPVGRSIFTLWACLQCVTPSLLYLCFEKLNRANSLTFSLVSRFLSPSDYFLVSCSDSPLFNGLLSTWTVGAMPAGVAGAALSAALTTFLPLPLPQLLTAVLGAPELLAHDDYSFLNVTCSFQRHTETFTGAAPVSDQSPLLDHASHDCFVVILT